MCESGCGSGSMSYALCRAIQPNGRLYSYDIDATRVACVQEKLSASFGKELAHVTVRNVCTDGFNVDGEIFWWNRICVATTSSLLVLPTLYS